VNLDISANGATVLDQSFATGAAAARYFTNNAVNLGSLADTLYSDNDGIANIDETLTFTTTSAGSGFYGNLLIGDPPSGMADTGGIGLTLFGDGGDRPRAGVPRGKTVFEDRAARLGGAHGASVALFAQFMAAGLRTADGGGVSELITHAPSIRYQAIATPAA
jgi:hypothetical protein